MFSEHAVFLGTIQTYSCEFLFQPIFSDSIFNLHFTAFAWCLIGVSANMRYKNRIKSNTWLNWMISKACLLLKMMYSIIISGSFMCGKKILYGGAVDALIVDWNGLDRWMDWLIDWINKNLRIEGSERERNKRHRDIWCENEWNQGGEVFFCLTFTAFLACLSLKYILFAELNKTMMNIVYDLFVHTS